MTARLYAYNGGLLTGPLRRILALAGWSTRLGWPCARDVVGVWGAAPTAWRGAAVAARTRAGVLRIEDAFLRSVLPGRVARDRHAPRGWRRLAARAPLGLILDPEGVHFDPARPSRLEVLIAQGNAQPARARAGIAWLRAHGLTKYAGHLPDAPLPPEGCVMVIDQTRGDAALMGANRQTFLAMLAAARAEHPHRPLVIRSHPETASGLRPGHLTAGDLRAGEVFHDAPADPWAMLARADAVYAVSSQLGYEAMLAGLRPRLFGLPFYAGWGLSDDEAPLPRRGRASIEALFTASHLEGPVWYDPCRDALTDFEGAARQLDAEARAWRQDHAGHRAAGIRLWKRPAIAQAFGNGRGVRFTDQAPTLAWAGPWLARAAAGRPPPADTVATDTAACAKGTDAAVPPLPVMSAPVSAPSDPQPPDPAHHTTPPALTPHPGLPPPPSQAASVPASPLPAPSDPAHHATTPPPPAVSRAAPRPGPPSSCRNTPGVRGQRPRLCDPSPPALIEDGFIRSRGLGAALTPPLSLVADDLGIYYDPSRPSRLEALIASPLPPGGAARATALIARLRAGGVSKYNLGGAAPRIDARAGQRIILVPGQVADDASIRLGATGAVRDNAALLAAARTHNPDAFLIYKPHPDVEAGLRPGAIAAAEADLIATDADPNALMAHAGAVWTLTSTLGFEALIRGLPVTCLGAPFYAGWGLTEDLAPVPARRHARPDLARLVHAALIAYPRYTDPRTNRPCPVEAALDLLEAGHAPAPPALRLLSKLQGLMAGQSWLWR